LLPTLNQKRNTMKTRQILITAILLVLSGVLLMAAPLGTAFNYNGRLSVGGDPATGGYDFRFILYTDAGGGTAVAGPITNSPVGVTNGLFMTTLDFGAGVFTGSARWLEIGVRTNGDLADFTLLTPRQPLQPVPYALYSPNASWAGVAASVAVNGVAGASIQNSAILASKIASGQVVKSLNGLKDDVSLVAGANITLTPSGNSLEISAPGGPTTGWSRLGNATAPGEFLGSLNDQPLEFKVNGLRALRLEPAGDSSWDQGLLPDGAPNVIAGSPVNFITPGVVGSSIGGGGATNDNWGNASSNSIAADHSAIGGGVGNTIQGGGSYWSVIAGGQSNSISFAVSAVIGGGIHNTALWGADGSSIGGGAYNFTEAQDATIGGGYNNVVSGQYGTVPGGIWNEASMNSFAAGRRAKARHDGVFVWADSSVDADFASTTNYQFLIRAAGGVGINTTNPGAALDVAGTARAAHFEGDASLLANLNPASLAPGTVTSAIHFAPAGGPPFSLASSNQVAHLNSDWLDGLDSTSFWKTGGNSGTTSGTHFLGTTDHEPLDLRVNNERVLRLVPTSSSLSPNLIGGSQANRIGSNVAGSVIAGGGHSQSGYGNSVDSDYSFLGGGWNNSIRAGAGHAVLGGGAANSIWASYSVIGGGGNSFIFTNATHATIGGGEVNFIMTNAHHATIAGGEDNRIQNSASHSAIGGGDGNRIGASSDLAIIGGGGDNSIGAASSSTVIAGGSQNTLGTNASFSAISGGYANDILDGASSAVIGGGQVNLVSTNADFSVIAGGRGNAIRANAQYAVIPGGSNNVAAGSFSLAAGRRAKAQHDGAFVWADATDVDFVSTAANQFLVRASGGVGIGKTNPSTALDVNGTVAATWLTVSDSTVVSNLNANMVGGLRASAFWQVGGNSNTAPGTHFLGTTDNQPLELKVNGQRGLRLEPAAGGPPNVIGGAGENRAANGVFGATIAGGGGSSSNYVGASHATIGGGEQNVASGWRATVPGGFSNAAVGNSSFAAGRRARANHQGAFVWADSTEADFASTGNNQFLIRAAGGVGIGTTNPAALLDVAGTARVGTLRVTNANVVTNLNADLLDGLTSADYWKLGGNNLADPATQFLGVTNNQPLEVRVNNLRVLRLEPGSNGVPNVIAGYRSNFVASGVLGATISGGGSSGSYSPPWIGGGSGGLNPNAVGSDYGVIGGGAGHVIQISAPAALIGGGLGNLIASGSPGATIGGGWNHLILSDAPHATIGGGSNNVLQAGAVGGTIAGGWLNTVEAGAQMSTIAGGAAHVIGTDTLSCTISGGAQNHIWPGATGATVGGGGDNQVWANTWYATIPGGTGNTVAGSYAFAAGRRAKALHPGAFVWADSQNADFASTAANQFLIRASGGVGIGGAPQDALLDIEGNARLNNNDLLLRHAADRNHGLGWYGSNYIAKGFAGVDVDGPVLYGYSGGVLGSTSGGNKVALHWTDDSRVGIGTAYPATSLHVASTSGPATLVVGQHHQNGGYTALYMGPSAVSNGYAYLQSIKAAGSSYGDLALNASGGNVGIGTTAPAQKLHVAGRIRMGTWTGDGTTAVYRNAGGDLGMQSSDRRLKQNIAPITNALAAVRGLTGVTFNWRSDPEGAGKTVGLIAQDVQAVLPELTFECQGEDGETYLGVHYEKVAVVLANAVNELHHDFEARLDQKDAEIQQLTQRLARLEALVEQFIK
jgi:hypothetical protein